MAKESQCRGEITRLLQACQSGDETAFEKLMDHVYEDLRRIAHQNLRRAGAAQTLSTTGLVHEAYLRLVDYSQASYNDRAHFFAVVSRAMRQILVNYALRWHAQKRGGKLARLDLASTELAVAQQVEMLVATDQALVKLAAKDERLVRIVECRFFAGLTEKETAEALGISERTVQREWQRARGWLKEQLA